MLPAGFSPALTIWFSKRRVGTIQVQDLIQHTPLKTYKENI